MNEICNISTELFKHSATIHIANCLSLLERKIYNVLLKKAYSNLLITDKHTINLSELKNFVGREGNNYDDIKSSIENLIQTLIRWNIFDRDKKNKWGATTFIAFATIEGNLCTYEYSSIMREFLSNPNVYAKLNLVIQNKFSSKYSLILWEFFLEKLCVENKNSIENLLVSMDNFRALLGIKDSYVLFKALNRDILKKAIKEINEISDIYVEMIVKKEGRKVVAIIFKIDKKIEYTENQSEIGTMHRIESNTYCNKIKATNNVKNILREEFKVSETKINKLLREYKKEDIEKSLEYVRQKITEKVKILNLPAYTIKAIKEGWIIKNAIDEIKGKSKKENMDEAENYLDKLEDGIKDEIWYLVWMELKTIIDIFEFRNWLSYLKYECKNQTVVELSVHSNFIKQEIEQKYLGKILSVWQKHDSNIKNIKIKIVK